MKAGWQTKTLDQISVNLDSRRIPITKADRTSGEYPYYGASGIVDYVADYIFDEDTLLVSEDGANLLARSTPIAFPASGKYWVNNHAHILKFENMTTQRFVELYLESIPLDKYVTGAAQPKLNQKALNSIPIPIPPLHEQRRITSILDEAFDCITIARANAEKNFQNARALFESHLQAIFTRRGEGWVVKKLGEVAETISTGPFGTMLHKSDYVQDGIPLVNPMNIVNGRIIPSSRMMVSEETKERLHIYILKAGDIVIGRRGELGRCALITDNEAGWLCGTGSFFVRLSNFMDGKFFVTLFSSKQFRARLENNAVGTTMSSLNHTILNDLPILVPPIAEQRSIIAKSDEMLHEVERLESIYQQKLVALDELKKSLLHKAFSGELTEQSQPSAMIPFPTRIPNITTTDLHAGILAIAFQLHEKRGTLKHFGHVKAEKIAHMVEVHVGIDLDRTPVKDAAGPNDYPHLKRVEHRARKAGFFDFQHVEGSGYQVTKSRQFQSLIERTREKLGNRSREVDSLLELMLPMDTQQAEIFCTVYAAWNNLLLDGQQPTDESIVLEAREKWHPNKLNIPREKFFAAIDLLRKKGVVPTGRGKKVTAKARKR